MPTLIPQFQQPTDGVLFFVSALGVSHILSPALPSISMIRQTLCGVQVNLLSGGFISRQCKQCIRMQSAKNRLAAQKPKGTVTLSACRKRTEGGDARG